MSMLEASAPARNGGILSHLATGVALIAAGAVVGAIGTVAHQSTVSIGAWRAPVMLVAAIVAVASLVLGARLLAKSRWSAVGLAVGIVGMIVVFSGRGPGGSVLIPNNTAGLVWVFAPAIICALVVLWPRLPAKRHVERGVN
jgi:hypothetical protein